MDFAADSEHTSVSVRCPNGDGSCGCDYLHTAAQRKRLKAAHNHAKCDGAPRPLDAGLAGTHVWWRR